MDLVAESAAWSRGEAAAWGSSVAGEVLFEFGPLGEKKLSEWDELEIKSLAKALERGLVDSMESWGLVSLCVNGRQRTGLQCRSYARQHLTPNEQNDAEFFHSLGGEAEACCSALRARAGGDVHSPTHFANWTRLSQQPMEVAALAPMEEEEELPMPPAMDFEQETPDHTLNQDFSMDNTNEEQTNDSVLPSKRKRKLRAVDDDSDDNDSSIVCHTKQTPQELHDFVVSTITRTYLDVCDVLQKKVRDLVLENKTSALDKRVTKFLMNLRHAYQINEEDDFLNGYDSDQANPDIPKRMSKRYFKELKRMSPREAKEKIRKFLDKAEELLEVALKVELVEEVDGEDDEEEEEAGGGNEYYEVGAAIGEEEKEEEGRGKRSKRERSACWIAEPSADREGEALEINPRRQHPHPRSSNPSTGKHTALPNTSGHKRDLARLALAPEPHAATATTTTKTTVTTATTTTATKRPPANERRAVSGNEPTNSRRPHSSLEPEPRRHAQRYGKFDYSTTDIAYMRIGPNSELPSLYEHPAQPTLRQRAPIVLSQSFFQPLQLAVKREGDEKKQPPTPVAIYLVREIRSAKGLDDLVYDFVRSKGNVSLWADLLERLSRAEMDVDYFHSLIRPLVECVCNVQSSTKRCLFLKTLRQVSHCNLATRNLLSFLMVYGHLESMLLTDSEPENELQVLESLGQDAWDVCLGALQVLKLGKSRYEVCSVVLDQWEGMGAEGVNFAELFPQPGRSTRRKALEWVEFSWVTLARVLPFFPPRANWRWIEDKLLASLPCWFGKHTGLEKVEEHDKWTKVLRAVWHRPQAVAGDYVALTAQRLLQLTQQSKSTDSFVPMLFRACCNAQSRDVACLMDLLRVELALPHSMRLVVENLNVVKQNASNKLGIKMLLALTECYKGTKWSKASRGLYFNELVVKCAAANGTEEAVEVALDLCRLASCAKEFDTVLVKRVRPVLAANLGREEWSTTVVAVGDLALCRSAFVGFLNHVLREYVAMVPSPLTREMFALVVDNLPLLVESESVELGEDLKQALALCANMAVVMLAKEEAEDLTGSLLKKVSTWAYMEGAVEQGFGVFKQALDMGCKDLGLPAQCM
ncbi:hypothetical protein BASA81_000441 [Batrachochytrium salamandrivorans]|nr:hypothetical protein BASA81_000441 [Batrachochytrium salamandrivorans]